VNVRAPTTAVGSSFAWMGEERIDDSPREAELEGGLMDS
jgi:hypothetical protein